MEHSLLADGAYVNGACTDNERGTEYLVDYYIHILLINFPNLFLIMSFASSETSVPIALQ
jgi:hypothetical protein